MLFGSNGNSYTVCTRMCVYTHCAQYRDAGRVKVAKILGQQGMPRAKEIFPLAVLETCAVGSPIAALGVGGQRA